MEQGWIVLIDKTPKGVFSTAEIKVLIEKGILKANDLAIYLDQDASKENSKWQFIWQYAEFKSEHTLEPVAITKDSAHLKPHHKVKAEKKSGEVLPQELASLKVEDLIPRANRKIISMPETPIPQGERLEDAPVPRSFDWRSFSRPLGVIGFGALLSVLVYRQLSPPEKPAPPLTLAKPSSTPTVAAARPQAARGATKLPPQTKKPEPTPPTARDVAAESDKKEDKSEARKEDKDKESSREIQNFLEQRRKEEEEQREEEYTDHVIKHKAKKKIRPADEVEDEGYIEEEDAPSEDSDEEEH